MAAMVPPGQKRKDECLSELGGKIQVTARVDPHPEAPLPELPHQGLIPAATACNQQLHGLRLARCCQPAQILCYHGGAEGGEGGQLVCG